MVIKTQPYNECLKLYNYLNKYINNIDEYEEYIKNALKESYMNTMQIIFYSRDCRESGEGYRRNFILAMIYISEKHPIVFERYFTLVPKYGRWLDLIEIYESITSSFHKMRIINFIIDTLNEDIDGMNEGESVTYLAKWLPSENKKHDRLSDISDAICKKLYSTANITSFIRRQYRKEYLSPLRSYIQICEKKMCENKWDEIHFSSVPSQAMKRYTYAFKRHIPEEFKKWERNHIKLNIQKNPFNPYYGYGNNKKIDLPHVVLCQIYDNPRYTI